jgi:Cu2+-exporting ATPase
MTRELPPDGATACVETRLAVPGISCASCIAKLEGRLPQTPGIVAARVNFASRQLTVAHVPELGVADVLAAVEALGFEAQPLVAGEATADATTRPLIRALAVAGFAAMNIMLLSVSIWSGAGGATRDLFHWLSAAIALPTVAYAGRPFFGSAWGALRRRRTNMDVPISIGVSLATGMSLYETMTGGPHAYFDGVVMLLLFLLAGRVLDAMMRDRAREGVAALLRQTAPGALVLAADGSCAWRPAAELAPGMRLLVAAGERLAADGMVEAGASRIDQGLITGEATPVPVAPGDAVLGGTLNLLAPLTIRVTRTGDAMAIAQMARLMAEAGQPRSRYVRIADRAARLYAPCVHATTALAFAGWMIAGAGWHQALLIAISVLIITCPCALGLAVPVAQVVAAGALMRRGILVKDGSALERLAEVDRTLIDKTGTLTTGSPVPADLSVLSADERAVALGLAQASRHPLSKGLAAALRAEGTMAADVTAITETPGEGLRGSWRGTSVALARDESAPGLGVTLMNEAGDRRIAFADPLRPDARAALDRLARDGAPATIFSGDNAAAVADVARALGVAGQANASPQEKLDSIGRLTAAGHKVLMVGDGLNDGPALAAAHASIAPGTASDVGQQAADLVFTNSSLIAVPVALAAARRTMRVVRQNFALAIGYNALAVPLALAGRVTPLVAAVAMSLSSLIVVANALRLNGAAR